MSMLSSDISVAESEGVPDSLHGSRSDTSSIELEGFNRLDVFDLGTINVYDETDDGDDSDYIEVSSLSRATSEDEVGMSVVSYESHFDEGSFVNRQNMQMRCDSMLMHNGGRDDSLALLSISSTSTSESRIIYRPPMRNASLNHPQTSSNFVDAPGPSVSLDVHSDKEASSIVSTSVEVLPVDSVVNSTENHVSLRNKVKNSIRSFFKRAWMAIKCPSLCYETTVEPFVPPPDDTEPDQEQDDADSSCPAESSGFQPNDESEEFGVWSGGFNTVNEETSPSNGKQTEDADCLDESSYSSDTSEDDCEEDVIVCGPFSILREKTVHRLGEWSFNSDLFIGEGGSDDSLYLLSISSGSSSAEEPSGAWQNGPARETCTCSCNRNMYAAGPSSMSLEAQSDNKVPPVNSVGNSTEKHTSLRQKIKNGISSFFKRAWKALKCSCCYCCCCCETTVEPFVPLSEDLEPDPQPAYSKPYFVTEPSSFKPADESREFDYEMLMVESGSFGFL